MKGSITDKIFGTGNLSIADNKHWDKHRKHYMKVGVVLSLSLLKSKN